MNSSVKTLSLERATASADGVLAPEALDSGYSSRYPPLGSLGFEGVVAEWSSFRLVSFMSRRAESPSGLGKLVVAAHPARVSRIPLVAPAGHAVEDAVVGHHDL